MFNIFIDFEEYYGRQLPWTTTEENIGGIYLRADNTLRSGCAHE